MSSADDEKGNEIFSQLQHLIEKECSKASFACGGSITISESPNASEKGNARSSAPINLFWTSANNENVRKLTLPGEFTESSVEQLAKNCALASFGRGEENVVDTDYRRAGKLDATQFASTFHPADFGLLENIEQILVPDMGGRRAKDEIYSRKIVADLYKLNVYSEPSGHFRNHVDTPRDATQIGSLVVCLPSAFEGGNLLVRHGGQELDFDWSPGSQSTIQWAAFYSDCEHEIKTVTKGHRITLTYNLHLVDVVGGALTLPKRIVDPDSLPPYDLIRSMLGQPEFMAKGGILGIYCSHAYAHTSNIAAQSLPRSLKGSDIILYSIFHSLGCEVSVRPVLEDRCVRSFYDDTPRTSSLQLEEYLDDSDDSDEIEDIAERSKSKRRKKSEERKKTRKMVNLVGTKLHPHVVAHSYLEVDMHEELDMIDTTWQNDKIEDIHWMTLAKHPEPTLSYVAYGNEASAGCKYSHAAILVVIPSWEERQKK